MNRWTVLTAILVLGALIALSCSGGGTPVTPTSELTNAAVHGNQSQTHLWGYYDVYIDIPTQTVTAELNRSVMFAANVVQFLNGNPANLQFTINGTPVGTGFVDVDIDVTIKHPFPGLTQYNGYDVRGIFMGNGSKVMKYNTDLKYAAYGSSDQVMYDYNLTNDGKIYGNPDGYTRWWNAPEFLTPGLFGYTPGMYASKGYKGTATLNPYKYYADGLKPEDDLFQFLTTTTGHGVFSAGASNTRNYYLRFPMPTPGVKYGYAVVANWIAEDVHPANAPEAVALSCTVTPDIYYENPTNKGGDLILDLAVVDWDGTPSAGVMEDYKIYIESTVLKNVYAATTADMTPLGGGANYSTYHIEIPADNIKSTLGQEFWVIVEEQDANYENDYGVPNSAGADKLAAFFRYDLYVSPEPYNKRPVCDLVVIGPTSGFGSVTCEFDASASYDPDGDPITFEWDFDGDGVFSESPDDDYTGPPEKPKHKYTSDYSGNVSVKVTDDKGKSDTCTVAVDIDVQPLYKQTFDTGATNWTFAYYQYWSGCTNTTVQWTNVAPFGPSGSGNVRYPPAGNVTQGGDLQTVVSEPFTIPSGAGITEINIRVYMCEAFGGSWSGFANSNWKIVESSTPGLPPFVSGDPAPLPGGGAYLNATNAHGGSWPPYDPNPCFYGPLSGQPGWFGSYGGGAFPGSLTQYIDLNVPSAFWGKTVKIAWQWHPDWCGYTGANTGFAIDDVEVIVY